MSGSSASIAASNPASAADLAEQLVTLEARAVAAEDLLAKERDAHAQRVEAMEGKLRQLEPWIRKLRAEHQQVISERDDLRKQPGAAGESVGDGARAEITALRAERDAALNNVAALTVQMESETADLDRRWTRRVEVIEAAREEAASRLVAAENAAADVRHDTAEIQVLKGELTTSRQTLAAHKAVARAAQEEVAVLGERAELLESSQGEVSSQLEKKLHQVERLEEKLVKRTRGLKESNAAAEDLREQVASARARIEELDELTTSLRGDAAAFAVEREQAEEARHEIETLRVDADEAKQALAKLTEESAIAQSAADGLRRELDSFATERDAARKAAVRSESDLEAARERLDSTQAAVAESIAESETTATRMASLEAEHRDATARIADLEDELESATGRCEAAEAVAADSRELEKLRSEVECGRSAIATLQSKSDALTEEVDSLRAGSDERIAVVESKSDAELEAVRSRAEAEMIALRERAERGEALAEELSAKLGAGSELRDAEMQRIRLGVCTTLGAGMQRLLDGMEDVLGPDMAIPAATAIATEPAAPVAPDGPKKWDDLMTELEGLRSEVEHFRDVDPEAVAKAEITASIEIDVLPGIDVPTHADSTAVNLEDDA